MMSWPSADELWLHQHHQPNRCDRKMVYVHCVYTVTWHVHRFCLKSKSICHCLSKLHAPGDSWSIENYWVRCVCPCLCVHCEAASDFAAARHAGTLSALAFCSAQVNPFSSSHHRMQGKERAHTSSAAAPAGQQQQASRHWQELLQHHKAPAQLAGTTAHSNPSTHAATAGDHGSTERPAWLSFLQGMLDAHQKHHLDGISISRDNSSIKHSKSSSSKQSHRKGHHALAAPVAAAAAVAAAIPADNSSTLDNDVAAPHSPTAHAAWPVCWPYV